MEEENGSTSSNTLLNQLRSRLQGGLKPTRTKTTFPDGTVQYSSGQGSSVECNTSQDNQPSFGFVVDDKPDLTVGKVRPWLFVSSQDVPNDISLLKEHGVSHILSLLPGFLLTVECANFIESHLILDMYDEESFRLDSDLCQAAFDFIDDAKLQGKRVLIHCNAGISRAPTMAIAYLMQREKLSFDDAFKELKSARPSVRPNAGFLKQLQKLPLCHS